MWREIVMRIPDRLRKEVRMSVLQRQCMIIVTLLATLLLLSIWPRFLRDALSVHWLVYILMIAIASIPLFRKRRDG
ncbi:MAG: hypothetical protein ACI80K_003175 [Paracoccaceae bacterium]|jgi:hypothetical protein